MDDTTTTATKPPGRRSCRPRAPRLRTSGCQRTRKKFSAPTCLCSRRLPRPRSAPSAPSTPCRTPRGRFIGGFKTPAVSWQPGPRACQCRRERGSGWMRETRRCGPRVRMSERAWRGARNAWREFLLFVVGYWSGYFWIFSQSIVINKLHQANQKHSKTTQIDIRVKPQHEIYIPCHPMHCPGIPHRAPT